MWIQAETISECSEGGEYFKQPVETELEDTEYSMSARQRC